SASSAEDGFCFEPPRRGKRRPMSKSKPKPKLPVRVPSRVVPVRALPPDNPKTFHLDQRADALLAADDGDGDELITQQQLALEWGVSQQWLEIRRSRGDGPEYERLSPRVIRYRRSKLRAFLDERGRRMTDGDHPNRGRRRPDGT